MQKKKNVLLLGAHMSTEGGLYRALERGAKINCSTIQIFTKNNRRWTTKPITKEEADLFKQTQKKYDISYVIGHASYLLNLGSPKFDIYKKSVIALKKELDRCEKLNIPYLVLHPGARLDSNLDTALKQVAKGIDTALQENSGKTMILLETMAGQGTTLGSTFEEIAQIRNHAKEKKRIGVCLDTCHIFAAGYEFGSEKSYKKMWETFNRLIGLKNLKVIHINESKKYLGSKIDRHENIEEGKIGTEAFKLLFNDKRFFSIPKILETPKVNFIDDVQNIKKLTSLLTPKTLKFLKVKNGREEQAS